MKIHGCTATGEECRQTFYIRQIGSRVRHRNGELPAVGCDFGVKRIIDVYGPRGVDRDKR